MYVPRPTNNKSLYKSLKYIDPINKGTCSQVESAKHTQYKAVLVLVLVGKLVEPNILKLDDNLY